MEPESTRPHTVPIIDVMALADYWYLPQLIVYQPGFTDLNEQCHCELQLQVPGIKDSDPTVNLQYRWFIDYDINNQQQSWTEARVLQGAFNSTNEVRPTVTFNLNTNAQQLKAGIHVVDFMIAEDAGFASDNTLRPHHRALNQGWDATTLKTVVNVAAAGGTRCDQIAGIPAATVRVCGP